MKCLWMFLTAFFSFVGKLFVPKCQNHFQIHNRIFSYEKFVFRLFECEQRFIRDDTKKLLRKEHVKKYICTKIASHAIEEIKENRIKYLNVLIPKRILHRSAFISFVFHWLCLFSWICICLSVFYHLTLYVYCNIQGITLKARLSVDRDRTQAAAALHCSCNSCVYIKTDFNKNKRWLCFFFHSFFHVFRVEVSYLVNSFQPS